MTHPPAIAPSTNPWEIGVCSWSIDRHDIHRAMQFAGNELHLRTVQIGFFTEESVRSARADALRAAAQEVGVTIVSTFAAFEREDYSSIATIAATGGYMSDKEYAGRWSVTCRMADLTVELGCRHLATHIGTVPADAAAAEYAKLVARVGEVADELAQRGLRLLVETGREPAERLIQFLHAVKRPNIAVNFDPGNFVVYGTDDPVQAAAKLKGTIEGVHMKDGMRSDQPGMTFGRPASLGSGEAQIPRVVSKLRATGYGGSLLIEAGGPGGGAEAIRFAAGYLRSMVG